MDEQRNPDPHYIVAPFTVLIDQREQAPFGFTNIASDAASGAHPLSIPTRSELLATGDYTIEGYADRLTVERKSVADFVGTLTAGRERFENELERAAGMQAAFVVCEGEWSDVLDHVNNREALKMVGGFGGGTKPTGRAINPKTLTNSVIAWQLRYPSIHWWFCSGRRMAEVITYRLLERFWNERMKELKEQQKEQTARAI
jgi:DNA excision repair protein ERCC-4